jgi:hypothetical protein
MKVYKIYITSLIDSKLKVEQICSTTNKHTALLAYEGAVVGMRYHLKNKQYREISFKYKTDFTNDMNKITIIIKEEYNARKNYRKRNFRYQNKRYK